jgi:hypothetical protein
LKSPDLKKQTKANESKFAFVYFRLIAFMGVNLRSQIWRRTVVREGLPVSDASYQESGATKNNESVLKCLF